MYVRTYLDNQVLTSWGSLASLLPLVHLSNLVRHMSNRRCTQTDELTVNGQMERQTDNIWNEQGTFSEDAVAIYWHPSITRHLLIPNCNVLFLPMHQTCMIYQCDMHHILYLLTHVCTYIHIRTMLSATAWAADAAYSECALLTCGWFLVISLQRRGCMKLLATLTVFSDWSSVAVLGRPASSLPWRWSLRRCLG